MFFAGRVDIEKGILFQVEPKTLDAMRLFRQHVALQQFFTSTDAFFRSGLGILVYLGAPSSFPVVKTVTYKRSNLFGVWKFPNTLMLVCLSLCFLGCVLQSSCFVGWGVRPRQQLQEGAMMWWIFCGSGGSRTYCCVSNIFPKHDLDCCKNVVFLA